MAYRKNLLSLISLIPVLISSQLEAVFVGPPSSSAGIVEKELQREGDSRKLEPNKPVPEIEIDIPQEQLVVAFGRSIHVEKIRFTGNTKISTEKLERIVQRYIHTEMTMHEIRELCKKVQDLYVKEGYFLARAFPPEQNVTKNTLTIQVIEGLLGEVSVVGNKEYATSFIEDYFRDLKGKPLNYNALMRAIILLDENADLNASVVLQKGKEVGTADIILRVADKTPFHLFADYNNYGSSITTVHRTGGRVQYGNTLFQGDMISLAGVVGSPVDHLQFVDVDYSTPLNHIGTKMHLTYMYTNFEVNRLNPLDLNGWTQSATMQFSHAVLRSKPLNLDVYGAFQYIQAKNFAQHATTSDDNLRVLSLGTNLDYVDGLRGRNLFDTTLYIGIPDFLGGLDAVDPKCSRVGAGGLFVFLDLDYKRIQGLPWHSFLIFNVSAQGTTYKLPITEQFYIGGFDTVRGYPLAVALGDNGYYANLEWRFPFPGLTTQKLPWDKKKTWAEFIQFLGFIDNGGVLLNGGGEDQKHEILLTGAGVGVRVYGPFRFNFSFDVGFPLTQEKKTSDTVLYFKVDWQLF